MIRMCETMTKILIFCILCLFQDLMGELQAQWHEITKLCQLFHTFPKRLKINVTLPTLEQQLIQIKNNQEHLEDRCKILLNSLKERSALWKRFTNLKREVKECSEVIEFRTDLLSIHGTIDYRRLAAISENLQVRIYFFTSISDYGFIDNIDKLDHLLL